jgi:hypothetical protein
MCRLLLESVNNPDFVRDLHGIDHAKRASPLDASAISDTLDPMPKMRFRDIGLSTFRSDRQGRQANRLDVFRKRLKLLECGVFGEISPPIICCHFIQYYFVKFDNMNQAARGAVSSLGPRVRKLSSVEATADPAITSAMGSAGLSINPRKVVATAAIKN